MTLLDSSKKFSIIIDTSYKTCIWLVLDCKILDLSISDQRPSKKLLTNLNLILTQNNLAIGDIQDFYFCKGPGSYTGLRISQGLEEYLKLNKFNCYDFYSFEILKVLELKYLFVANAFKKEFFVAEKNCEQIEYRKISKDVLNSKRLDREVISYDDSLKDEDYFKVFDEKFSDFFNEVLSNKLEKDVFYYRSLSEEYKRL